MRELIKRMMGSADRPASSHPGRLHADFLRVAGSYPLWPIVLAVAWLIALLAVLDGFDYGALALLGIATFANYRWWAAIPDWFLRGDVCPAAIVSEQPLLIAILTDLTAGEGEYPAVKVRREPAKRWPPDTIKVGRPVACIAMYDGTVGAKHWANFHPRPAQCATGEEAQIKRLLAEIDKRQWASLQAAIRQLPKPIKPGLYRLDAQP